MSIGDVHFNPADVTLVSPEKLMNGQHIIIFSRLSPHSHHTLREKIMIP